MRFKKNICFGFLLLSVLMTRAQETQTKSKTAKATEKVTQKANEISNDAVNQSQQIAGAAKNVISNAKAIINIFEPILRFRLKKKSNETLSGQPGNEVTGSSQSDTNNSSINPVNTAEQNTGYIPDDTSVLVTQNDINQGVAVIAESPAYNTDGTANLGSQNHKQFGCYIDIQQGAIMDEIDAAGMSGSVDIIFTATNAFNEQVPMYAFLTPAYVKHDAFAYNFFKGAKYKVRNIPPAIWEEVNESEVAITSITGVQFEKIRNNDQLMAVVKQTRGFGQKVESRTKLDGKVLAVKTEMSNRTVYGLIYIVNHYGTTGENGYLKIKLKVTGFDANGDGIPDGSLYMQ